jgi:hypothetical protein
LPGYAKALVRNPREALGAGLSHQWQNSSTGEKIMAYGLPGAFVGKEALTPGQDEQGRGRLQRVGEAVGQGAFGLLGPLPLAADQVMASGIGKGLGTFGRAIDRLKQHGVKQPPTQTEPPGAMTQPSDYQMSDRAAGITPDGAM